MRILVFSWRDPKHPLAGGAEQVMHEHMKGWIKGGHQVTLFASRFKGSKSEELIDEIKIIRKGYQYLGVQIAAFFFYLSKRHNYDFIVDQFHGLPFFTPIYIKKPILAVIQETARNVWFLNPLPKPLNWIVGILGYLGEPFIFLLYKKNIFMTGSESAKAEVMKYGIPRANIEVVPHGIIIQKPKNASKEKSPTITFLGVLSKDKGIEDALRCFSILSQRSDFQFWVIGRPETLKYGEYIKHLIKQFGIDQRTIFWGFVSQEKKFELLKRSHILVNPSVREGWGLVNIEANFMETPVIAYRSPGLIDSVKDGQSGILCRTNTPEELASVCIKVITDKIKYKDLQEGAYNWSKQFSWDKSKAKSLLLLKKIANG